MAKATAPFPSEAQLQESIVNYIHLCCPDVFIWHIPNGQPFMGVIRKLVGEKRAKTIFKRIMSFLVRIGFKAGLPDLELRWYPGQSILWEVKTESGDVRDKQEDVHYELRKRGSTVEIIRSLEDARASIERHNIPCRCH